MGVFCWFLQVFLYHKLAVIFFKSRSHLAEFSNHVAESSSNLSFFSIFSCFQGFFERFKGFFVRFLKFLRVLGLKFLQFLRGVL
jgi:hypothetical protein